MAFLLIIKYLAPVLYQAIRCMAMLPQKLFGSFWVFIWNWPLHVEGREKPKKKIDHCRLAGGNFIKQENLLTSFVLSGHKTNRFPHLLTRTINVYSKGLTVFTYHSRCFFTTFLFQCCMLRAAFGSREGKVKAHSKDWERMGSLQLPRSSSGQLLITYLWWPPPTGREIWMNKMNM